MKNFIYVFIVFLSINSCKEKEYKCVSIGAEDCKIDIKDKKGTLTGKECGATNIIYGSNNEEVKSKCEKIGFECKEN